MESQVTFLSPQNISGTSQLSPKQLMGPETTEKKTPYSVPGAIERGPKNLKRKIPKKGSSLTVVVHTNTFSLAATLKKKDVNNIF